MVIVRLAALVSVLILSGAAAAQQRTDGLVGAGAGSSDPIGIDESSDLQRLSVTPRGQSPEEIAARGPRPPTVRPQRGEVLAAPPGVRETQHDVAVRLAHGLALAEVTMRFASRSHHPAEVSYRLAVPEGATLAGLSVCTGEREPQCREGVLDPSGGAVYDDAVRARGAEAPLPVAHVEPLRDARGPAIRLRAAPVPPGGELVVHVRWLDAVRVRGGVARLSLPARGSDPRVAPSTVRVDPGDLLAPTVDGTVVADRTVSLDAWYEAEITARVPEGGPLVEVVRTPCGDERGGDCVHARVRAGPREGVSRDLIVLVDASPSTIGPARGRIGAAVAALFEAAPAGTWVRAMAFGARVRVVLEEPTDVADAPLVPLAQAAGISLGPATRFETAWAEVERWLDAGTHDASRDPLVVIVGDGGLSSSPASRAAFASARRRGVEVSVVNVADRRTWSALRTGVAAARGVVVEAGDEAELASRGRSGDRLREAVSAVYAPRLSTAVTAIGPGLRLGLGSLRAGEERVWDGRMPRAGPTGLRVAVAGARVRTTREVLDAAWAPGLAMRTVAEAERAALIAVDAADLTNGLASGDPPRTGGSERASACDPLGPPRRASGVSSDAAPVAQAEARTCGHDAPVTIRQPPPNPRDGRGVPEATVLDMLRHRLVPHARGCFRADRRGRADYSVRAEFELHLAARELVLAEVHGEISDELRACLHDGVDRLEIPPFAGTVVVHYPLVTERDAPPPVIELEDDVAREVDRIAPNRGDAARDLLAP